MHCLLCPCCHCIIMYLSVCPPGRVELSSSQNVRRPLIIVTAQQDYNCTKNIRTRPLCARINPVLESPPQRDHNKVLSSMWSPIKKPACSPLRYRPAPQDLQVNCTIGPLPCARTALQTLHEWGLWAYWPKGGQESGELPLLTRFP